MTPAVTCEQCQKRKRWLIRKVTPGEPVRYFCSPECLVMWRCIHEKKEL